jgi:REP element-mobilizing transposase RayT
MRQPRIKVAAEEGEAVYHCMSRTVNGERLFDDVAKEVLRKQFRQVADYCGVRIVTHTVMANHFHVLVRVPQKTAIPDDELLRRYAVLYPQPTRYQTARLNVIRQQLATDGPEAVIWRRRQLALMGDVSQFMKLVKQRFSIWFNKSHQRYGTLWAERFKSVLVEPDGRVLRTMAAYIDLNGVRAGLVQDPKDYRFCGYAEAVAGQTAAQEGLQSVFGSASWPETQAAYRQMLFGTGAGTREHGHRIPPEALQQVLKAGGQLPLATVLRCRVRYFTDGAVLGSKAFVALHLAAYRRRTGQRGQSSPQPLPPLTDWGELTNLRGLRRGGFG